MKGRAQRKIMHKQMLLFLQLLSGYLQNNQKNNMDDSGDTSQLEFVTLERWIQITT